jgi:ssDNA-binding replication factor A large subunit
MKGTVLLVGYENKGSVEISIKSESHLTTSAVLLAATMQLAKEMDIPSGLLLNGWKAMSEKCHANDVTP